MRLCRTLRLNGYRITRGTAGHEDYRSLIPAWNQNRENADRKSQTTLAGRRRRDVRASSLCVLPIVTLSPSTRRTIGMTKIHPERPDSDLSDHSLAAEVLLRQEPDEEEEDEDEEGDGKEDDDDDGDDGYSE